MWPNQRYAVPVKPVKSLQETLSDMDAHQPYDVKVYRYSKGAGIKIYHINYYNKHNDLLQAHCSLFSFPAVYENIDCQWLNYNTIIVWFPGVHPTEEMKFKLSGDEIMPQVEREY